MIVNGEGPLDAKLWIIGEAPGRNEEVQGRPFVGGAGWTLDGMLHEVGIDRKSCYIDNVIQVRPSSNDFSVYYQDKNKYKPTSELLNAHARLQTLVNVHKPNVVLALGNEAMFALTGHKGVMNWRGSILGCRGVKVIPTIHPASIMRQYEFRQVSIIDMYRAKQESLTPLFPQAPLDKFITNPSYDTTVSYLKDVLPTKPYLSFDIETIIGAKIIQCIGFGWSPTEAICIPMRYGDNHWWTLEEELQIVKLIRELFLKPGIKFIAQNAQFDMVWIADAWNVHVPGLWMDTMLAFHCVYPEMRKGLDFINSVYTNRPYYKGMRSGDPATLWTYNCLDAVVTLECALKIREELVEFGTDEFHDKYTHPMIKILVAMQRRGVRIDITKRAEIKSNLEKDIIELQRRLDIAVGHSLNFNSPLQVKKFLYDELKLPPKHSRATGNVTANEEALEELAKKFPNPAFTLILELRHLAKLLNTYIEAPIDEDSRIRCSYVITGTETGRLSSRESVYGTGTNLQNIPRGELIRSIFVPDEECMFVEADLSQAEARVVAYVAGDYNMIKLFELEGSDIHKRNAAMIFKKPEATITPEERQLAKSLVHAANYGIGARTFAKHIGSSENHAQGLLYQYHSLYPSIKLWHKQVELQLKRTRILTTPLGRKRTFFNRWGPDLIKEAIAYVPQSTVSDILNCGIIKAWSNLPPEWEILMQVHDSVLMQVPTRTEPMHIYKFIKHYFENWIELDPRTKFKIPIEIKTGGDWGHMKKLDLT